MKLNKLALSVSLGVMAMTMAGCEQQDYSLFDEQDTAAVAAATTATIDAEKAELAKALKELQATDPDITDLYYSVNDAGEKVLHVVKEKADGSVNEETMALMNGMLLGMLMSNIMHMGSYGAYANANRSYVATRTYSKTDYRRQRNSAAATSYAAANRRAGASYRSSSAFQSKVSARSAMFSGGGARSGGYSSGG